MEIITQIQEISQKKAAIAIGKFEGIHLGHQKLIKKVVEKQQAGFVPVAFTFDVSPRLFFQQENNILFTQKERNRLFEQFGVSILFICPFTKEFVAMEAERFVEEVLLKKLHAGYLAVGEDFRFGKDRKGDVRLLKRYAGAGAFELEVIEKEWLGQNNAEGGMECHEQISSTKIRELIYKGKMEQANEMLGFAFFMEGTVVKGNQLGRTWGIPTANIMVNQNKLLPPSGVYFSRAYIEGQAYSAITNIGIKPTIGKGYEKGAETHIYNFNEDIYGKRLVVELLHFKRKEQKFASREKLLRQLQDDVYGGTVYFGVE